MSQPTGLVLQGGGARGAFECGVIRHLYGSVPGFGIDAIAGVSIGAINAACLVGGRSRTELSLDESAAAPADRTTPWAVEALWESLKLWEAQFLPPTMQPYASLFGHPRFYWPRTDYASILDWTSYFGLWPLKNVLEKLIDFDRLNSPTAPRVTLVALNVKSGEPCEFKNFDGDRITLEHILASGSLPPGFPMTPIEDDRYWDGGLFDNTPLESVIDALVKNKSAPSPSRTGRSSWSDELLIYLVQLIPCEGVVPENQLEVQERMNQVIFSNKSREDADRARQVSDYLTLVREIMDVLPAEQAAEIKQRHLYRKLEHHRPVKLVPINMEGSGRSLGAADFSVSTIDARIAEGVKATIRALDKPSA